MTSDDTRGIALALLRRGEVTIAQAARFAGVSRQRVTQWCEAARIDARKASEGRAAWAWTREEMRKAGLPVRKRTKAELRQMAERAVRSRQDS